MKYWINYEIIRLKNNLKQLTVTYWILKIKKSRLMSNISLSKLKKCEKVVFKFIEFANEKSG